MQKYEKKLVAVLLGEMMVGEAMNALAHMSLGVGASVKEKKKLLLVNYTDGEGEDHKNLSELPFIILKAKKSKEVEKLRKKLIEEKIYFVDYPNFLNSIGTFGDSKKSKEYKKESFYYCGVVIFDDWDRVSEITKKFSLWR